MYCTGPNIKITEGNAFALILPLKSRHFVSDTPIDEDIDCTRLEDVRVFVGSAEWHDFELKTDGVYVGVPATMARDTYNVELTATYNGIAIRAGYYECFTIVKWSYQADAQNYIPASPIAAEAAYIIAGNYSDEELDRLKEELRAAIADADEAKTEAIAKRDEYVQRVEELEGIARQGDDEEATNTAILEAIRNMSAKSYSGHIDEVGLRAIGWTDEDINWFSKCVDWDEAFDERMKVPQEMIDHYNAYMAEHGRVDQDFFNTYKGEWWYRYSPLITPYADPPVVTVVNHAPYMIAAPDYIINTFIKSIGSTSFNYCGRGFRYLPKIINPRQGGLSYFCHNNTSGIPVVDVESNTNGALGVLGIYQRIGTLIFRGKGTVTLGVYSKVGVFTYIEGSQLVSDITQYAVADYCLACYLKGLAMNIRFDNDITKEELLFALRNEATDGETAFTITLRMELYNVYSADADIVAELALHPNWALAGV